MVLDFSKIGGTASADTALVPRDIFNLLTKKVKKYQYLRDVQAAVLDKWHQQRNQRDAVLKMNTGSGKTVVGLLILKSCLNEGIRPAAYFCPDNFLVGQVVREAKALGIEVAKSPDDSSFLTGKAILVSNIYVLINGRSRFGVGPEGVKIPLGAFLVDDAHACLATAESQFTLTFPANHNAYKPLLSLFADDLRRQSSVTYLDVESQDPNANMLVPFWAWQSKHAEVAAVLNAFKNEDKFKFVWPLIRDCLPLCRCVFGGGEVEISPRCLPIEVIPSFVTAKRRVFTTATLSNDSILVSDFGAKPEEVRLHITPVTASDIGDRMILVPEALNPEVSNEELKDFFRALAEIYNVVVIVPSSARAELWKEWAKEIVDADNVGAVVGRLSAGHVGLVVMINKYDGVDLPGDACRILVLDGLPQARRQIEKIESSLLFGSDELVTRKVQKLEQGMGRAIRSNDDYCVVFLMGKSLTSLLYAQHATERFSPATRVQMKVSEDVARQVVGKPLVEVGDAIKYCLGQDVKWLEVSKGALVDLKYDEVAHVDPVSIAQRHAFDAAFVTRYDDSVRSMQSAVNDTKDLIVKGWLRQQLAEYRNFTDAVEAQSILRAAVLENRRVLRPLDGIRYEPVATKNLEQTKQAYAALSAFATKSNELIVRVNALLEDLVFRPETADAFEAAICEMAYFLGFVGQRPELEYGRGPDVLWGVGNLQYFVVECKNGVTTPTVCKTDCNQLNGSMNWFREQYDSSCTGTAVMVHPSNCFDFDASPHESTRVITTDCLTLLKSAMADYAKAAVSKFNELDPSGVSKLLDHFAFKPAAFLQKYTTAYRRVKPVQTNLPM